MEQLQAQAHQFLVRESSLLDDWQLLEWAELFTADGEYLIPTTGLPEGKAEETLHLIYDDRHRLQERAKRLLKRTAHVEFPRSRTLHTFTNVGAERSGDGIVLQCAFVVYRSRRDQLDIFPGRSTYDITVADDATWRIRRKRSVLALETLRPHNKLSIII
ncbi:MAG: aromatic-ring-hydroxylating dioxygenase subunit beta [Pigmentiphaga sp.]